MFTSPFFFFLINEWEYVDLFASKAIKFLMNQYKGRFELVVYKVFKIIIIKKDKKQKNIVLKYSVASNLFYF